MTLLKGLVEGNLEQVKQQDINADKLYMIKDLPDNSITNEIMQLALTDNAVAAFFQSNNVYVCIDEGTYLKNHIYKYTGINWQDVSFILNYSSDDKFKVKVNADETLSVNGLVSNGDGTQFLSNDGTYKEIESVKYLYASSSSSPINLVTDMEVNKLYVVKGYIRRNSSTTYINLSTPVLFFKTSSTTAIAYNIKLSYSSTSTYYGPGYMTSINFNSSTGYMTSTTSSANITNINGTSSPTTSTIYAPTSYGSSGYVLRSRGSGSAPNWYQDSLSLNGTTYSSASNRSLTWYAPTSAGTSGQILKSNGSGAPSWINNPVISTGDGTKYLSDDGTYKTIIIPEVELDEVTINRNTENKLQAIAVAYTNGNISGDTLHTATLLTRYED